MDNESNHRTLKTMLFIIGLPAVAFAFAISLKFALVWVIAFWILPLVIYYIEGLLGLELLFHHNKKSNQESGRSLPPKSFGETKVEEINQKDKT